MAILKYQPVSKRQRLAIHFSVLGREPWTAFVTIKLDSDPQRHGLQLLGKDDDPMGTGGFSIVHANALSPLSRTYAALYGWVQITNISYVKKMNLTACLNQEQTARTV